MDDKALKKRLKGKVAMHMLFGLGGAVVIIGALFKILHLEFGPITGGLVLGLGLGTEALIFTVAALNTGEIKEEHEDFVKKVRSFHFNWGKFYFYKKNYNYFFALKKILPNFRRSIKKMLISIIKIDKKNFQFSFLEFLGIICSLFLIKSFYRPNK